MVKRKYFLSAIIFLSSCCFAFAQSATLTYARYVIDTLTSAVMYGRGYTDSSDFKAALFIQHEFQGMNLSSLTADYFQPFYLDANTFPGKMKVKLGKRSLLPGQDFLVDAASKGLHGKFRMVNLHIDSNDIKSSQA